MYSQDSEPVVLKRDVKSIVVPAGMEIDLHKGALVYITQAMGGSFDGRRLGTIGDLGCFSLQYNKIITCGEGGIVTTNSADLAASARLFRNHGMPERYRHTQWGLNFRMTDILAAIGRVQLERLPEATQERRTNAKVLDARLPEFFSTPPDADDAYHVYHQYTVSAPPEVRDLLVAGFREKGIGVDVYYPIPLHHQPAYEAYTDGSPRPRAEAAAASVISLPIHPKVGATGLERIVVAASELEARL